MRCVFLSSVLGLVVGTWVDELELLQSGPARKNDTTVAFEQSDKVSMGGYVGSHVRVAYGERFQMRVYLSGGSNKWMCVHGDGRSGDSGYAYLHASVSDQWEGTFVGSGKWSIKKTGTYSPDHSGYNGCYLAQHTSLSSDAMDGGYRVMCRTGRDSGEGWKFIPANRAKFSYKMQFSSGYCITSRTKYRDWSSSWAVVYACSSFGEVQMLFSSSYYSRDQVARCYDHSEGCSLGWACTAFCGSGKYCCQYGSDTPYCKWAPISYFANHYNYPMCVYPYYTTITVTTTTTTTTLATDGKLSKKFTVQGVDYSMMVANPTVKASLETKYKTLIKERVKAETGFEVEDQYISVLFAPGSLSVKVDMLMPSGLVEDAEAATTGGTFEQDIVDGTGEVPGVTDVTTGAIGVDPIVSIGEALPAHCTKVFLDLGASIGVQVRKLMEPNLYPGSPIISRFNKFFGDVATRTQPSSTSGMCVIMVEPVGALFSRLAQVKASYPNTDIIVWPVLALDHQAKQEDFYVDERPNVMMYGSSRVNWDSNMRLEKVEAEQIENIISKTDILNLQTLFIKMDIEGDEWTLLPHMLTEGMLCFSHIKIGILWHNNMKGDYTGDKDAILNSINTTCALGSRPDIFHLDDETYLKDGQPLTETTLR